MKYTNNKYNVQFNVPDNVLDSLTYTKKVDIPYAVEIISEIYGDVLPLLNSGSIIYGGIIRDIIADMFPLQGDLDIITPSDNYSPIVEKFSHCNKIVSSLGLPLSRCGYTRNTPLRSLRNFKTYDGRSIQVMSAAKSVLDVINSTDLVCCGVVMTHEGEVFEVISGAEEECRKRILTINKRGKIDINITTKRIKKLVGRGWESNVNMSELKRMVKRGQHTNPAGILKKPNVPVYRKSYNDTQSRMPEPEARPRKFAKKTMMRLF